MGVRMMADDVGDYARKTYRYLRLAIVAMVFSLLLSMFFEYVEAGELLGSFSAYYYSPVNPLFVGTLIMIGVCLIAIRGTTDFEDIALNISGLLAPVVALVPTGFPWGEITDENADIDPDLYGGTLYSIPTSELTDNTIWAMLIALAVAAGGSFLLAKKFRDQNLGPREIPKNTWIGLGLAIAAAGALIVIHQAWGSQRTHEIAAVGVFGGLFMVAMANGVRHVRDKNHRQTIRVAWAAGAAGSLAILGVVLVVVGIWRLIDGENAVVLIIGAAAISLVFAWRELREGLRKYLAVFRHGDDQYCRRYLLLAGWMVAAGPVFALVPVRLEHKTWIIEFVELVPFAIFWVIQTIEHWNSGLGAHSYDPPATSGT